MTCDRTGMPTIEEALDGFDMRPDAKQQLKSWLETEGFCLGDQVDEEFLELTDEALRGAGLSTLRDRRLVLASLQALEHDRAFLTSHLRVEGPLASRSYLTRRTETCAKLFHRVDEQGYLLLKAPPHSGKTSTLQLLCEWAIRHRHGVEAVYIDLSDCQRSFQLDDVFRAQLGSTLCEVIDSGRIVLVCVDSVHRAYNVQKSGSVNFWNQLRRLASGLGYGVRVVMAADYGPRHADAPRHVEAELDPEDIARPFQVDFPGMVVTVLPSLSGCSLQLPEGEWAELWDSYTGVTKLSLGNVIKDHLAALCSLQPGLLVSCLEYLEEVLADKLTAPEGITFKAWKALASQEFLQHMLHVDSMSIYGRLEENPAALHVLRQLCWVDSLEVPFYLGPTEAATLSELCRAGPVVLLEEQGTKRLRFTSPLHQACFVHRHIRGATC